MKKTFIEYQEYPKNNLRNNHNQLRETWIQNVIQQVAGMEEEIIKMISWIENALDSDNLMVSRCFLIHGPSGSGKSKLVNCIAKESKLSTFHIFGGDVHKTYQGDAEINLLHIFKSASSSKSIIIIEDFDMLCPSIYLLRSSRGGGLAEKRIISLITSIVDSINNFNIFEQKSRFYIIAITSRLSHVEPSLC